MEREWRYFKVTAHLYPTTVLPGVRRERHVGSPSEAGPPTRLDYDQRPWPAAVKPTVGASDIGAFCA